jgi:hypothetical protein
MSAAFLGLSLVGQCNQCGFCCTDGDMKCEHLEVTSELGAPMSTRCIVYDKRYDGMPIAMLGPAGSRMSVCRKDSADETSGVMSWIGRGCSLDVAGEEIQ